MKARGETADRPAPDPRPANVEANGAPAPSAAPDDPQMRGRPAKAPLPAGSHLKGRPRPRLRSGRWLAVPWTLFVLALAAAVLFASLWQRAQSDDRRRAEVVAQTTTFLTALTNFKGATISADVARIRSYAVGDFAGQVKQFFGAQTVAAIRSAQATSAGKVRSVFVESIDGTTASVFGVVDETVTNKASATPRTEVLRAEIELIQTKDGWKVDRVDILQSPGSAPFGG